MREWRRQRTRFRWTVLIPFLALSVMVGEVFGWESDFEVPTYPSRKRYENDTYEKMLSYWEAGERQRIIDLINADPSVARSVVIRLLRDPSKDSLTRAFATLFPLGSMSAIEEPLVEFATQANPDTREGVLDAFQRMGELQIAARRRGFNDQLSLEIAESAPVIIDEIIEYLDRAGFEQGRAEALSFKGNYISFFDDEDLPRYLSEAASVFRKHGNLRGLFHCYWREASFYWFTGRRDEAEKLFDEYFSLLDSHEDPLLQVYLHYTLPGERRHLDEKWPLLERLPGLPIEKVETLLRLNDDGDSRVPKIEEIINQEDDPLIRTRLHWMVFTHFYYSADPRSLEWGYKAIELAEPLGYDISAFKNAAYSRQIPATPAVPTMLQEFLRALRMAADYTAVLTSHERALRFLEATSELWTGDQILVIRSTLLTDYAGDYRRLGDYEKALETAQSALELYEVVGETHASKMTCRLISDIFTDLGDFDSAEAALLKALAIPDRVYNYAPVLLGELNLNFNRYEDALRWLNRAKAELDEIDRGKWWRQVRLELMTKLWLRIGDLEKALDCAQRRDGIPGGGRWIDHSPTGEVLVAMGNLPEARDHYLARLEATEGKNLKQKKADALKNLGRIECRSRSFVEGVAYLNQALELVRATGNLREQLEVLNDLAICHLDSANRSEAKSTFGDALLVAETMANAPGIWTARYYLGQIAELEDNRLLAVDHYRAAIEAVESVAGGIRIDLYKASFLEDKTQIYDRLISLLGPTQSEEAFFYAERRRAQAYLDSIRARGLQFKIPGTSLVNAKRRAERRLIATQTSLRNELVKPPSKRESALVAQLEDQLLEARKAHSEVLRRVQLQRTSDAYREGWIAPLRVEAVQSRVLQDGQALVQYVVTDEEAIAFVIDSKRTRFFILPANRKLLSEDIKDLLAPFRALKEGTVDLLHLDFDVELSHRIYQRIFEPLEPALAGNTSIIIVPDGALHYLPFESLARSAEKGPLDRRIRYREYESVDWLVKRYSIAYAVSATSLDPALAGRSEPQEKLVAFAEPLLGDRTDFKNRATLRGAVGTASMIGTLKPIPEASREVSSIGLLMSGKTRTITLEGARASEKAFFEHAPNAKYLHFAVHSFVDDKVPDYSTLVLSADDESDGFLQGFEILQARLGSRLVTLSACETALGRLYRGEGLVGLKRSFLVAGARSMLVSLWSIEDSSADFMEKFYERLSEGVDLNQALRKTKLEYLKKTRPLDSERSLSLSHPFFWAPFTLTVTSGY